MKALESRKRLLIAESELNRTNLICDCRTMAEEAHRVASRAKTIGSAVSVAALLFSGLSFFRRKQSSPATAKPSWWQAILKVAGMAGSFWSEFRSQHLQKDKS